MRTVASFFLALLFFLPSLKGMPLEKRVQMCFVMQDALKPQISTWWQWGKIGTSTLVGLGASLAFSYIDPTEKTTPVAVQRFNRLVKAYAALNKVRAQLNPNVAAPRTFSPPEIPASPSLLQMGVFALSGVATYFLLTLFADRFGSSHIMTLKAFLADWPDYAFYAPQTLREEAGSLYGAYLRQGDEALGDEDTAELILIAFDVFLTEEIQAISNTLQ